MESSSKSDEEENQEILREVGLSRVRMLLSENKVELWKSPYFGEDSNPVEAKLLELSENLASSLCMDVLEINQRLLELQKNALTKLAARETLQTTGKVSLKLKISKSFSSQSPSNATVLMDQTSTGLDLAKEVSKIVGSQHTELMLVSSGKTLKLDDTISNQGLKPGTTVMILKINPKDSSWATSVEQRTLLQLAKDDARILGSTDDLQITNQFGEEISIPKDERNSLIIAMSLHEKGKAALSKRNFDLALAFLLEASGEYETCRSEILKVSDNYGVLNLDIVWCYYKLQNIAELPNGEKRLNVAEASIKKSYGENYEKIGSIKEGGNQELVALLVRLKLLKAVIAFHNGNSDLASSIFKEVEKELKVLHVPQELIDEVAAQGFSRREACQALRATGNKVPAAVRFAENEAVKARELNEAESENRERQKRLGRTSNGSWINIGYLKTIMGFGYSEELAAAALKQTNNDIDGAMKALDEDIEMLIVAATANDEASTSRSSMVEQLTSMGFEETKIKSVLKKSNGNIDEAITKLTEDEEASQRAKKRKKEATSRMAEILVDEDVNLITLQEEQEVLTKYKNIMHFE